MADYLADAKERVDKAVAAYDAGVTPEAEVDKLMCEASAAACEALKRFHGDDDHWAKFQEQDNRTAIVALKEIILKKFGNKPHFNERCLPATADALRRFGFKPPEEAEALVSRARDACDALTPGAFNLAELARAAREAVGKLADVTCGLAKRLREKADSREKRQKLLKRARAVFLWVGLTLGGAMITHAVDSVDLQHLSDAGRAAVCIVGGQSVKECAEKGIEEQNKEPLQDEDDDDEPVEI